MSLLKLLNGLGEVNTSAGGRGRGRGNSFQDRFARTCVGYAVRYNKTAAFMANNRQLCITLFAALRLSEKLDSGEWTAEGIQATFGYQLTGNTQRDAEALLVIGAKHLRTHPLETKDDRKSLQGYITADGASTYVVKVKDKMLAPGWFEEMKAEIESEE